MLALAVTLMVAVVLRAGTTLPKPLTLPWNW